MHPTKPSPLPKAGNIKKYDASYLDKLRDKRYEHGENSLTEKEKIAGFIYIGTASEAPKERARPELQDVLTHWLSQ